ncbi:MAG TPA: hypothetical protein PKG95_01255 [Anaerolineaceae bacterium]|nr:hypothetical protein [Anaerolineaceae bacterium]
MQIEDWSVGAPSMLMANLGGMNMKKWAVKFGAVLLILGSINSCNLSPSQEAATTVPTPKHPTPELPLCDGGAYGTIVTWLDANANGLMDPGELPLSGVKVWPAEWDEDFYALTDRNGEAQIFQFRPGCCDYCWKDVTAGAEVPEGYSPTTPTSIELSGPDETYYFGFVAGPGIPTPTPYAPKLSCVTYPLEGILHNLVTAPDGTLWVGLSYDIAQFNSQQNQFVYYKSPKVLDDLLLVDRENTVWIRSLDGRLAALHDSEWITFDNDSLLTASILSLGSTSDGTVWFVDRSSPDIFASFNPNSNEWHVYYDEYEQVLPGFQAVLFNNGTTWFAAFDYTERDLSLNDESFTWEITPHHVFSSDEQIEIPWLWPSDSLIDSNDTLWFSYLYHLVNFVPQTGVWNTYDIPDPSENYGEAGSAQNAMSPDHSIWFVTRVTYRSNNYPIIWRYFPDNKGSWLSYDDRDIGLGDIEYDLIAFTGDGKLWLAAEHGQAVYSCEVLR